MAADLDDVVYQLKQIAKRLEEVEAEIGLLRSDIGKQLSSYSSGWSFAKELIGILQEIRDK